MFSRGSKKKSLKTVCSFICVIWVNMHSLHALWLAAVQTISPYKHNCIYSLGYLYIWHAIYLGEHIKRDLDHKQAQRKQNLALCVQLHCKIELCLLSITSYFYILHFWSVNGISNSRFVLLSLSDKMVSKANSNPNEHGFSEGYDYLLLSPNHIGRSLRSIFFSLSYIYICNIDMHVHKWNYHVQWHICMYISVYLIMKFFKRCHKDFQTLSSEEGF